MRANRFPLMGLAILCCLLFLTQSTSSAQSLKEANELLFEQLQRVHGLSDEQMKSIRAIFSASGYIGQGNPAITRHPLSPEG